MSLPLPERASDTTAEQPWPVRVLSLKIQDYVDKMSVTWVEGQVVQLNRRPGSRYAYLTLRDPDVDMSLSCMVRVTALDAMLAKHDRSVEKVLMLTVDEDEVVERLLRRAEVEGRADDTEDVIRERQAIYARETGHGIALPEEMFTAPEPDGGPTPPDAPEEKPAGKRGGGFLRVVK